MVESVSIIIDAIRNIGRRALQRKWAKKDSSARQELENELAILEATGEHLQYLRNKDMAYVNQYTLDLLEAQPEFVAKLSALLPQQIYEREDDDFVGVYYNTLIFKIPDPPSARTGPPGYTVVIQ